MDSVEKLKIRLRREFARRRDIASRLGLSRRSLRHAIRLDYLIVESLLKVQRQIAHLSAALRAAKEMGL